MLLRVSSVLLLAVVAGVAQNPPVTINVDVQSHRHAISPLIYGVNLFESPNATAILQDLNAPINRYGGNRASTYNWNLNSDNRGNDFFFESIVDDTPSPAGARTDTFITTTKAAGAEPMVTVPMLDWMANAGQQPYPCSYPAASFPAQDRFDLDNPHQCGNGLNGGQPVDGADPNLALVPNSLPIQQAWLQHTVASFNSAVNGGVKYYILDNEHDLWAETHHDAVPQAPHYTDDFGRMRDYAIAIKSQDNTALVAAPEVSGWLGYVYSPFDVQDGEAHNFANDHLDHDAIGGDYMPWLLSQFKQYADANNGQRLLDVFTVHYYPQGGDNNSNTRSLWDPAFVDPSFIDHTIMLIPRMKQWVSDNYPGTKIGITEYNWGSINDEANNDSMAFAVTQADVLGIFGREGLDLATRFNAPPTNLPTYNAMKMYRNYDGQKSTFGDISVSTTVPDPDTVAAFTAQRSADNKVTMMLLSKYATGNTPVTLDIANFAASSTAQRWQLSAADAAIQHPADIPVNGGTLSLSLPPQSVTLLVLAPQQQQPAPFASFNRQSLDFGTQLINTYSLGSTITLSNTGTLPLNIARMVISGAGLQRSSNCPPVLNVGSHCSISIKPTATGLLNGMLTITDDAADSPQSLAVSGTGKDIVLSSPRPNRSRRLAGQIAVTHPHAR